VIVAARIQTRPWVVPPVKVAMRLSMLLLATGENQRFGHRELRGHVVVVVEESLVVIAHRALPSDR
jgi:hypothetical protein